MVRVFHLLQLLQDLIKLGSGDLIWGAPIYQVTYPFDHVTI